MITTKKTASIGAALAVAGAAFAVPLAAAPPAQAVTTSPCKTVRVDGGIFRDYYVQQCYRNFNWFEEVFLLKNDGWYGRTCELDWRCDPWYWVRR